MAERSKVAGRKSDAWRPLVSSGDFPPTSATGRIEVAAETRKGRGRAANTDHYLAVQLDRRFETILASFRAPEMPDTYDEHGYALVVADGLGDPAEAELASRIAVASLAQLGLYFGKWNLRIDETIAREVMQRVARFYRYIDGLLIQSGGGARQGVQSTLTAALSAGDQMFVVHVGHSRAYLLRDHELIQLTRDHTLAERRVVEPTIVDANSLHIDGDHVVISSLGGRGRAPEVDLERLTLADGDMVLLSTNGLPDVLPDDAIVEILESDRFLDDRARLLVETAAAAGAQDDVTVLVARYAFPAAQNGARNGRSR